MDFGGIRLEVCVCSFGSRGCSVVRCSVFGVRCSLFVVLVAGVRCLLSLVLSFWSLFLSLLSPFVALVLVWSCHVCGRCSCNAYSSLLLSLSLSLSSTFTFTFMARGGWAGRGRHLRRRPAREPRLASAPSQRGRHRGADSCRRDCRSAAPPSPFSRRLDRDREGSSAT